jgi:hypothetical protein
LSTSLSGKDFFTLQVNPASKTADFQMDFEKENSNLARKDDEMARISVLIFPNHERTKALLAEANF